jgi:hypothetical protein
MVQHQFYYLQNLTWNNTTNTLSATFFFLGSGASLTSLNAANITSGTLSVNGSGLTSLNAANITSGTVSRGGIGTTNLNSNQNINRKWNKCKKINRLIYYLI